MFHDLLRGYLVLPLQLKSTDLIDWEVVRRYEQSDAGIEMKSCWPTDKGRDISQDLVLTHEQGDQLGRIFKIKGTAGKTMGELVRLQSLVSGDILKEFFLN